MKINIIGAGISGLSAACYLQMNGFETQIFEKNPTSGGLCATWKRGDYVFDGCLHWIMGTNEHSPFFKLWNELIDMKKLDFFNHESRMAMEIPDLKNKYGENVFHLYTNIDRLEAYLTDLAPEDAFQIRKFTNSIRKIQKYELPPLIDKVPAYRKLRDYAVFIKYIPFVFLYLRWKNVTNISFAKKLKNPFIKEAFRLLYNGGEVSLIVSSVMLAFYDKKCAGYPVGGSYGFAKKIEEKYFSLGGKIFYNSPVQTIITENGTAKGVLLNNGKEDLSDITISAADWRYTVFNALGGKFVNKKIKQLNALERLSVFYSIVLVSLGIKREFKEFPHFFRFAMKPELISPDGTKYKFLECHFYNYDSTLTSKGKTVVSFSFYTVNSDYWIDLRRNDKEAYNKAKMKFAEEVITCFDKKIVNVKEHIEEMDVATPATYNRYTNNWKGSIQGWMPGKHILAPSPVAWELPGLKQFYYGSHWSMPGGGVPVAIKTGRDVAQIICKKYRKPFISG
jgi:phytoene dehydrogenase-like protein